MLVLSRTIKEKIAVLVPGYDQPVVIEIVRVSRNRVRVGVSAPSEFPIRRWELIDDDDDDDDSKGEVND